MEPGEQEKLAIAQHEKNRESLLANEAFAITMQQVVAGGILIGILSKLDDLQASFGVLSVFVIVLSGMSLISAVLAAQMRHDYRMWDVKASAAGDSTIAAVRLTKAGEFLRRMRLAMWTATVLIIVAIALVIIGAVKTV